MICNHVPAAHQINEGKVVPGHLALFATFLSSVEKAIWINGLDSYPGSYSQT